MLDRHSRGRSSDRSRLWRNRLRPTPLVLFMVATCLLGLPIAGHAVGALLLSPPLDHPLDLALLVATLVLAELLPIRISRASRTDEITISSTFALALAVSAPLGLVVLAQGLPTIIDDLRRGKDPLRPLFNVAQYTLTFAAARFTLQLVAGDLPSSPSTFAHRHLLGIVCAGVAFLVVNHGLVGTAVALSTGVPVHKQLPSTTR